MRPRQKASSSAWAGIPGVEPHADAALAVEDSAGDELAFVREEIDDVAVGGAPLDAIDRRVEHPGVSAVERPRLAGFEDDLSRVLLTGREVSGKSNPEVYWLACRLARRREDGREDEGRAGGNGGTDRELLFGERPQITNCGSVSVANR